MLALPPPDSPPGGDTTRQPHGRQAFALPAANIQKPNKRVFFFGNRLFNTNWTIAPATAKNFDGVGPTFNRVSCSGCHLFDGRGRPPAANQTDNFSILLKVGVADGEGNIAPHPDFGGQLQDNAIDGVAREGRWRVAYEELPGRFADGDAYSLRRPTVIIDSAAPPRPNLRTSARVAPAIAGVGLLEAVDEADIIARADPRDANGDGISGRAAQVARKGALANGADGNKALGRFGWKAAVASLTEQNALAAWQDIGLTNPLFPDENCLPAQADCAAAATGDSLDLREDFLRKLTDYTRLLAVPARRAPQSAAAIRGGEVFAASGCASCHTPTMRAGDGADILPELRGQVFHPYTDLLLHDMGEGLADEFGEGDASGREWRTAPLWGLGLVPAVNGHSFYLHDGRARNIEEAILWHGGEAASARESYKALTRQQRADLQTFINSL